jgi:hypothetical protein
MPRTTNSDKVESVARGRQDGSKAGFVWITVFRDECRVQQTDLPPTLGEVRWFPYQRTTGHFFSTSLCSLLCCRSNPSIILRRIIPRPSIADMPTVVPHLLLIQHALLNRTNTVRLDFSLPGLLACDEYLLHLLESFTCSLGKCEEHMDSHHGAENTKHNVHSPLDVDKGRRHKVRQGEVEDPICRSTQCDGLASHSGGEELRRIDPRHRPKVVSLHIDWKSNTYPQVGANEATKRYVQAMTALAGAPEICQLSSGTWSTPPGGAGLP